jgi:hypothetical protein
MDETKEDELKNAVSQTDEAMAPDAGVSKIEDKNDGEKKTPEVPTEVEATPDGNIPIIGETSE